MKRTNLLALGAFTIVAALAVVSQADALQSARAFKIVDLTFLVTPSPTPIVYRRPAPAAQPAGPARAVAALPSSAQLARFIEDRYRGPAQLAWTGAGSPGVTWDVPPGSGMMIAQTTAQPTPVPVQFVAKADPNAAYLRVIPHYPAPDGIFHVGYGTTAFPCAFEIFTFYATANALVDWGYGTKISGAPPPTFPIENYPTASYLSWAVPDFSPTFKVYANSGSPGQQTWSGLAGQSQQHCINLSIFVPDTQPSGTFSATIQYTLNVN